MKRTSRRSKPGPSLKEKAYARIKRMIVEGTLEPGAFLSERQVSQKLGVSGSPVRAALERLSAEGFVTISPQRGTVVRDLSFEEIADQFEFRTVIESYVAQRLAGKLSAEQIAQLEEQLDRQKQVAHAKKPDGVRNAELDIEFHLMLSGFLGNKEMHSAMNRIHDKMKRVILRVNHGNDERLPKSYEEHLRVAKQIIAGDAQLAGQAMKQHLEYGRDFLLSGGRAR